MNIYVGNLAYEITEGDLRKSFEEFGQVENVKIINDINTGMSKGFGFVEMASQDDGRNAISSLNGKELKGRALKVNEARNREDRPQRRENSRRY